MLTAMERSTRLRRWPLALVFVLMACARGTVEDGPDDGATTAPDAQVPVSDEGAPPVEDAGEDTGAPPVDVTTPVDDVVAPWDAAPMDTSSVVDASMDAAPPDAGAPDTGPPDTGPPDAGTPDAAPDGSCSPVPSTSMCTNAVNLGNYCGDTSCGVLCPSTRARVVATRTGTTSQWFRARAVECSLCGASTAARVNLTVPADANYDLFVYRSCGSLRASSVNAAGAPEQVQMSESESALDDDSFDYIIEVRHVSGASCTPWTLTIEARSSSGSSC